LPTSNTTKMKKIKFWGDLMTPMDKQFLDNFDGVSTIVKYSAGTFLNSSKREQLDNRLI
jgi:hypothetical protein